MSVWRSRARARIAELTRDLPPSATVEERRKVLWGKGDPAHQGTVWGRRMWGKEVRRYLATYGDSLGAARRVNFTWPDDIAFPFRGKSDA